MPSKAPSAALRPRLRTQLGVLRFGALALAAMLPAVRLAAQGCVPVKQMGDISCSLEGLTDHSPGKWSVNFNYQGFRSHRHFVGTEEQTHRAEERTEVVNVVNQLTTSLTYALNSRTSFSANIPYFHAVRSSLYEHDRVNRHETRSQGIGDISIGGQMWMRSPLSETRGNVAFGLALKLPTGDTNAKDIFQRPGGPERRTVDQSIQPGDGGWGVAVSAQAYQRIGENTSLYATGFYLINPKETNGTFRSNDPIIGRFSVYDQYQARAGISHLFVRRLGLAGSLGLRMEGVPAYDLIGSSKGYRRPGYSVSVEPGISLMTGRDSFSLSVPVAVQHNRVRSYYDRQVPGRHGDAAFADFLINFNYTRHW